MTCRGDPVEMTGAQWHETTGSIKDVHGHGAVRVAMTDGCSEHRRQPDLVGQSQQPGGMPKAGGSAFWPAVADHLDNHPAAWQQVNPLPQEHAGMVGTTCQQGLTDIRGRSEQDHQSQGSGPGVDDMLGDELCAADRSSAFTTEVGLGHQTTQPAPAGARVDSCALAQRQHCHPRMPGIDLGAPSGRVGPTRRGPPSSGQSHFFSHSQIHPQHRSDTGLITGLGEPHRTIEPVAVGQGERGLAQSRGTFHQRRGG